MIEPDQNRYKILVIDPDNCFEQKVNGLSEKGYLTDYCIRTSDALDRLFTAEGGPYALIIVFHKTLVSGGNRPLVTARKTAPAAQRMLIIGQGDIQPLVDEINASHIHACMFMPFSDEELFHQVKLRCIEYESGRKKEQLQKTIHRQNNQLYLMAEKLKKEDRFYAARLKEQNKEIRIQRSRLQSAAGPFRTGASADLKTVLTKRKTPLNPRAFEKQFFIIREQFNQIFERTAARHGLPMTLPADPKGDSGRDLSAYKPVARQITQRLLNHLSCEESRDTKGDIPIGFSGMADIFQVDVTPDKLEALIRINEQTPETVSVFHVRRLLEKKRIVTGVVTDAEIESWLYDEEKRCRPLTVARGIAPVPPVDGKVKYHFTTAFLRSGTIRPDGSMDFRDRGQVPHVNEDVLLATKEFPSIGKAGVTVFGEIIDIPDAVDPAFSAGTGTVLSEDGRRIFSAVSGQPHLDIMGNVTVCREYEVKGDVGYETGNIAFDGNVVVKGSVRQGFSVKCVSLTAEEISGAEIDISGDLNVSMGIVDTELVQVKGSVRAGFVRNSRINAFGDMVVQKEIIDSTIFLSGACINQSGIIVSSVISAKRGIIGNTIGNNTSKPLKLTVGIDEHANRLMMTAETQLVMNREKIRALTDEMAQLQEENHDLHALITRDAHIQDRSQLEMQDLEKEMAHLKKGNDSAALKQAEAAIQQLSAKARDAEYRINKGFRRQDAISSELSHKEKQMAALELSNEHLLNYKQRIMEFAAGHDPVPEIIVNRHIQEGTRIISPNTSKIIDRSLSRCRIIEEPRWKDADSPPGLYEIKIRPL